MTQSEGRLERRLRRILTMLPFAIRHPGISVGELSHRFDVPENKVVEDLELVFLCGLPGYGPGDLIDVSIVDDRVFVDTADYFATPLRLTPVEALELYAGGQTLMALPEMDQADALERALGKLGKALGMDAGGAPAIQMKLAPGPARHLGRIREALAERRRLRIEYLSASRGELSERSVDPWALIVAWGRSYLVGWDHLSEDERMFRTDRIKSLEVTADEASVPDDFDAERYSRAFVERADERVISLELSPEVGRWFLDYYPIRSSQQLEDSWVQVHLATSSDHWAATVVLRLGDGVRAISPKVVEREARALAATIAAAHRD